MSPRIYALTKAKAQRHNSAHNPVCRYAWNSGKNGRIGVDPWRSGSRSGLQCSGRKLFGILRGSKARKRRALKKLADLSVTYSLCSRCFRCLRRLLLRQCRGVLRRHGAHASSSIVFGRGGGRGATVASNGGSPSGFAEGFPAGRPWRAQRLRTFFSITSMRLAMFSPMLRWLKFSRA